MRPSEGNHDTADEQRIVTEELARTAAELRGESRSSRAGVHDKLAEGEHAIEHRLLAAAGETEDPAGARRRGHAWSARAEEHRDSAADLRGDERA